MKRARDKKRWQLARRGLVALAGLLVPLAMIARPGGGSNADRKVEAKGTFERICASCHGLDGRGAERGPDIVSRQEVVRKTDAELLKIISEGRISAGMPSFASQGGDRLAAIVSYLRTLQGATAPISLPGDPGRGKTIFYGKAHCSQCHAINGQGGFLGPDLSGYAATAGIEGIRSVVVNPNKDIDERRGLITVTLVDSRVLVGLARNQDNFSLQLQTLDGGFHLLSKADIRILKYEGRSAMPADYGATLSPAELNDLISFLLRTSGPAKATGPTKNSDDEEQE